MMSEYDFLIVGSGLYGAICAYELNKKGYKCLVVEKRSHIGGNIYCEEQAGIHVHKYGAHIFHTSGGTLRIPYVPSIGWTLYMQYPDTQRKTPETFLPP